MPWDIREQDNRYCVYQSDTDELVACHDTREQAQAQIQAIYASYEGTAKEIDLKPTDAMREEAQRGLDWRREFGRGGTAVGIARARDIVNNRNLSPSTVKRMYSFFSRHEGNKQAEGFRPGEDGYPSNGRIAWAIWGGDPGFSWSKAKVKQMENAEKSTKAYAVGNLVQCTDSGMYGRVVGVTTEGMVEDMTATPDAPVYSVQLFEDDDGKWELSEEVMTYRKDELEVVLDLPPLLPNEDEDEASILDEESTAKDMADAYVPERVVKMLGGNRIGGYAVIWGDEETKDSDGEYFTKSTRGLTNLFGALGKLPLLYSHAMDSKIGPTVTGIVDVMEEDEWGLWYEAQLDRSDKYKQAVDKIRQLVSKRALGTSSGVLPMAKSKNPNTGEITQWPIVELSLTPTPADYRQLVDVPVESIKSTFGHIGVSEREINDFIGDTGAEKARPSVQSEIEAKLRLIKLLELEHDFGG